MLLCWGNRFGTEFLDGAIDFAGNVAFEASYDLVFGFAFGEAAGEDTHTLIASEMPTHTHELPGLGAPATAGGPGPNAKFATAGSNPYRTSSGTAVPMAWI